MSCFNIWGKLGRPQTAFPQALPPTQLPYIYGPLAKYPSLSNGSYIVLLYPQVAGFPFLPVCGMIALCSWYYTSCLLESPGCLLGSQVQPPGSPVWCVVSSSPLGCEYM